MEISALIGVLLVAAGGTSAACVLYTIQGDYKSTINRLFFCLGACIAIWSFGLAVQTAGASASIRFIGSRIAPIGYPMMFAILLHYVLLITRRSLLQKWWIYPCIYLPGAASAFGLSILPAILRTPDTMLQTSFGWVNVSSNFWVDFYYVYYIVFFLIIVLLLIDWIKKATLLNEKKQAKVLLFSMLAGVVLGSITDVGLVLLGIRIPSIASIFSAFPMLAISYSVKRYGFMQPERASDDTILDRHNRPRVYRVMGYCFLGGSVLNLLSQQVLYQETALSSNMLFSVILLLIGLAALFLSRLALDELFREFLFGIILAIVIPLVTLRFSVYASITIWPFFVLLLLISLLFSRRILIVVILLSALLTQLLVWSMTPNVLVTLDAADHMVRAGLIGLTALMSLHINKIYRRRLRANAGYSYVQAMVSEISQSLVSADESNFDKKTVDILEQCSLPLQCERGYLMLWDQEGQLERCCEWRAGGGTATGRPHMRALALCCLKIRAHFLNAGLFTLPDAAALPEPLADVRTQLLKNGMRGLLLTPIVKGGQDLGFMVFGAAKPVADWEKNPPQFLSLIANTIADTVIKMEDVRRIEWTAYHDLLTGLPNRPLFRQRLCAAIEEAAQTGSMIGIAFIDLDSFKTINDTMGHEAGDLLLREVAAAISRQLGEKDTIARFGGDEFVLLLRQAASEQDVIAQVRGLLRAIQSPVILRGQEFYVTSSIGVSLYPRDGQDAEVLMKNADIAMYEAKGLGKNQYVMCSESIKDRMEQNAYLTSLLYRALERDQLVVYYQPQISLETGEIVGLEALLRWNLPGSSMVCPATFIPLAEQTGLIQSIGAWVLETACRQNKRWQEMGFPPVRIAVNISVQQLENRNFVRRVADILRTTGLPPEYLELEVTESVANSNTADMVELMTRLKGLGISLSIDDFGTEYSSLERLKLLPIDRIKMDMQFVRGIENSDKDKAIAQVIISLAKSLHMKVLAEGVETEGQLDFLSRKLCDEVQGFYYFKPMPKDAVEAVFMEAREGKLHLPIDQASVAREGMVPV